MILTCPSCGTQYAVKDGAIPPEGRQVRCAACKHSWHQEPEPASNTAIDQREEEPGAAVPDQSLSARPTVRKEKGVPAAQDESFAEATLIEPRSGPEAEERAYEETLIEGEPARPATVQEGLPSAGAQPPFDERVSMAQMPPVADWQEPPEAEAGPDMFTPFATEDAPEPRRRGPLMGVLILVLLVIVLAAAFWFLAPAGLKARLGLAATDATPLQLVTTHMDRQHLESGNDLLTLTGRVINPSAKEQVVPPIQAQLKNKNGQVVYSWTIQPPVASLAPGGSASFNSAEVSVPPGGDELTITLRQALGRRG